MDLHIIKKRRVKGRFDLTCLNCGIIFTVPFARLKTRKNCSVKCQFEYRNKHPISNSGSFKKGHKCLLLEHTDETRAKMSKNSIGKKAPNGIEHWNWQGGITNQNSAERVKFRRTTQKTVLVRDNFTCQMCSQYGGKLQVDHIKSWAKHPELRFNLDNCRTLCMACHYYITFKRKMPESITWGHNLSRRIA